MNETLYAMYREAMVEQFVGPHLAANDPLLDAFVQVARHRFVPSGSRPYAYEEQAVPIGEEQMLTQPSAIARVLALAELNPSDRVLDVGCGSGYQMALAACVAAEVYGLERSANLAAAARHNLADAGIKGSVFVLDGLNGLPAHAPFDVILCGAAVPTPPEILLQQLAPNGRLVAPMGDAHRQTLTRWTRTPNGYEVQRTDEVLFSPFVVSP